MRQLISAIQAPSAGPRHLDVGSRLRPRGRRPALSLMAAAAGLAALSATPGAQAATYVWTAGDYVPGLTSPSPLLPPDLLQINPGTVKRFTLGFENQASVAQADLVQGVGSIAVLNSGLWDLQADAATLDWAAGSRTVFRNSGTFQKSAGVLSRVGDFQFINDGGLIRANSGVLEFNGGVTEFNAGTRFAGAGTVRLSNNATVAGSFRSDNLEIASGVTTGVAAQMAGGVAGPGEIRWTGGDLAGTWTIPQGRAVFAQDGAASKRLNGGTFTVNGSLVWASTQPLLGASAARLRVFGLLDIQQGSAFDWAAGSQSTLTLGPNALMVTRAGVGFTAGDFRWNVNGAQLEAEAGASVLFNGAQVRFLNGTRFTGAGSHVINGTATLTGTLNTQNLVLAGGAATGGTSATTRATMRGTTGWTGGDLRGNWTFAPDHQLLASAGVPKRLNGVSVNNRGLVQWDALEDLQGGSGATWRNEGRFEVLQGAALDWTFGSQPTFQNIATGVVQAKTGVTFRAGDWAHVSDGGLYTAEAGATIVFDGNSNTFREGTRFFGAGVNRIAGHSRVEAGLRTTNLEIAGGTVTGGDGLTAGSRGRLDGPVKWVGGDLAGAWTLPAGTVLTALPAGAKRLVGTDLVNEGSLLWQTAETLQGTSGAVLRNAGVFEARQSATLDWTTGSQAALVNAATGVVRASSGAVLALGDFALTSEGGVFNAFAGSRIDFGGTVTMQGNTRYTGAGLVRAVGNARYIGAQVGSNLQFISGVQTGGDGTATSAGIVRGTVTWEGGDLAGRWQVEAGQTLRAVAGTTVPKRITGSSLVNLGTLEWTTADTLQTGNGLQWVNDGTVRLQADANITFGFGSRPAIVNNGLWHKSAGAGTSSIAALTVANNGVMWAESGTIALPAAFTNAGTLAGTGTFSSATLTNQGIASPGQYSPTLSAIASPFGRGVSTDASTSTGTLSIAGNYVQAAGGALDIQLTSATQADLLAVTGSATLGGTLNVSCLGTCSFAAGQSVTVLQAGTGLSGNFSAVNLVGLPSGSFTVTVDTGNRRVVLTANQPVAAGMAGRR